MFFLKRKEKDYIHITHTINIAMKSSSLSINNYENRIKKVIHTLSDALEADISNFRVTNQYDITISQRVPLGKSISNEKIELLKNFNSAFDAIASFEDVLMSLVSLGEMKKGDRIYSIRIQAKESITKEDIHIS